MSNPLENIAWDQRLARILAGLLAHTSIHPNAVTTLGLMMGLLAGCLFAQGDLVLANWAAGVFMFAAFMDHADGELARLVNKTSTFGHYYDHVAVAVSYVSLFVGMGIGLRHGSLGGWALLWVLGVPPGRGFARRGPTSLPRRARPHVPGRTRASPPSQSRNRGPAYGLSSPRRLQNPRPPQ